MAIQIAALAILALIFIIGTWKPIHLGLLSLTAAFGVGFFLAGETFKETMSGFPVGILVLLVGVTYLFAIAREAGVVDWIIHRALRLIRGKVALIPLVFFALAVLLASMGSPLTCVALTPVAMIFVARHKIDPVLMGLAVTLGGTAGGFAPTSLYGLITNRIAAESGIEPNPLMLFAAGIAFNTVLMAFAFLVFGGRKLLKDTGTDDELASAGHGIPAPSPTPGSESGGVGGTRASTLERTTVTATDSLIPTTTPKLNIFQKVSLISLACLVTLVVVLSALNLPTDVGVLALGLAVLVSILFPSRTKPALRGIDWSTILLVGGIVTYVGVLERVGAMELLGHAAASVNQPLLAAFVICLVGAFISAFASTTGILGALIPLSLPLMATGNFVGYGLIVALALSASLVDTTPFSTAGATAVASAPEEERPRMTKIYMRWGFSMIIIAPILTVTTLVLPTMF